MRSLASRQRMARALKGEPTDRPPLAYLFLGGARHILDSVGQSMRKVYADPNLMASTQIAAAELFGHDSSMIPWGCLTVEAEAFGCELEHPEQFYPQVVSRPLENEPNLSLLRSPNPETGGRMPVVLDGLTALRNRACEDSFIVAMVVSPFLVAAELRSMTLLLIDFIRDPSFVHALMEKITDGVSRYVEAIVRNGSCDAIMFENAGATRDLIGPHHVSEFVTPYHRQLLAAARKADPDVLLIEHNCSDNPYFDDIIVSDVDAISFAYGDVQAIKREHGWDCHSSHTKPNCCIHRYCLRHDQSKQHKAWIGNVDHTKVLLHGTPEEVYTEARAVIESARGGPFCLSTGCEIPFKAPIENIWALAQATKAGF